MRGGSPNQPDSVDADQYVTQRACDMYCRFTLTSEGNDLVARMLQQGPAHDHPKPHTPSSNVPGGVGGGTNVYGPHPDSPRPSAAPPGSAYQSRAAGVAAGAVAGGSAKSCKCGATDHRRINSAKCPLNPRRTVPSEAFGPEPLGDHGVGSADAAMAPGEDSSRRNPKPKCSNCEEIPATLYCVMCSEFLCIECNSATHRNPTKRQHSRIPINALSPSQLRQPTPTVQTGSNASATKRLFPDAEFRSVNIAKAPRLSLPPERIPKRTPQLAADPAIIIGDGSEEEWDAPPATPTGFQGAIAPPPCVGDHARWGDGDGEASGPTRAANAAKEREADVRDTQAGRPTESDEETQPSDSRLPGGGGLGDPLPQPVVSGDASTAAPPQLRRASTYSGLEWDSLHAEHASFSYQFLGPDGTPVAERSCAAKRLFGGKVYLKVQVAKSTLETHEIIPEGSDVRCARSRLLSFYATAGVRILPRVIESSAHRGLLASQRWGCGGICPELDRRRCLPGT